MSCNLEWIPYVDQQVTWPQDGRHILAQYDDTSIVVYQAYRAEIADWAVGNQRFGGPWSFQRMSWIKPNFLWMMYRSGWATKPGQERVLAIRLQRKGFEAILAEAVESSHHPEVTGWDRETWRTKGKQSGVRLQWDPDHLPRGGKTSRRAVQLGLRGEPLRNFGTTWVTAIEDITDAVREQREALTNQRGLFTPREVLYRPFGSTAARIRLDPPVSR